MFPIPNVSDHNFSAGDIARLREVLTAQMPDITAAEITQDDVLCHGENGVQSINLANVFPLMAAGRMERIIKHLEHYALMPEQFQAIAEQNKIFWQPKVDHTREGPAANYIDADPAESIRLTRCPRCLGRGFVMFGALPDPVDCGKCDGTGLV